MDIYRLHTRLMTVMEVTDDFSFERKDPDRNRCATLGVEAPARQGVRSAHIGNMPATNNAARRDVSVSKVAELFRSGS
jgi:hypothetical protein